MYIAMNRFQTSEGKEKEFEDVWRQRNTYLEKVPGFKNFNLLKGEEGVFISHSTWESKETFLAWTESEAFQKAHQRGGIKGLLKGPPQFSGWEVVL